MSRERREDDDPGLRGAPFFLKWSSRQNGFSMS
jgi:hypothetical protein